MVKHYCAFLVRCWRLDDGERRIEIAHIQSGARTRVTSIAAALAWISARSRATAAAGPPVLDPSNDPPGTVPDAPAKDPLLDDGS